MVLSKAIDALVHEDASLHLHKGIWVLEPVGVYGETMLG